MKPVKQKKILYVQYTNPAGYPPLEHSSRILAKEGWRVLFLGIKSSGAQKMKFPDHEKIEVILWPFVSPGIWQKIHFIVFNIWAWLWAIFWRPDWIYGSDPLACPLLWVIKKTTFCRVVYHEHDSPLG